ncbi:NADH-quinone oxidoreductase subunit C [Streptomyces albidoflavus]|uniref:NADH-quinone oxidoreductase subunit C n=1 Tax=Streptomyces albidoflavus TaxID=1886 RepID=UPI0024C57C09|nr:NADH-ubiquinone oxidoreductase chain C [Streptomyces albidoflavus]
MTGWLPHPADILFGPDARAEESYDVLTVDVPAASWTSALGTARSVLGCTFFDWLSAVDEPGTGFLVSAHLVALAPVRRLLLRTTVPHEAPVLESAVEVFAGAAWHERETHEMFGVSFTGHPALDPLLLPENFEGHPLRKDFVLAARVAKAWPGAKEPGEGPDHGGPKRRQMLPPGVPDPNEWGPLKGLPPPRPARPPHRFRRRHKAAPPDAHRDRGFRVAGPGRAGRPGHPGSRRDPDGRGNSDRRGHPGGTRHPGGPTPPQEPLGLPGLGLPAGGHVPTGGPVPGSDRGRPGHARRGTGHPSGARVPGTRPPAPQPLGLAGQRLPAAAHGPGAGGHRRHRAVRAHGTRGSGRPGSRLPGPSRARPAPPRPLGRRRLRLAAAAPAPGSRPARAGSSDAPWHHAKPAHEETREETPGPEGEAPEPENPAREPRRPEEGTPDDDTPTGGDPA